MMKWNVLSLCETRIPEEKYTALETGHMLYQNNSVTNSALLLNGKREHEETPNIDKYGLGARNDPEKLLLNFLESDNLYCMIRNKNEQRMKSTAHHKPQIFNHRCFCAEQVPHRK